MRRIALTILIVFVGAGTATACDCVARSDAKYRQAADVVFAGTVVAVSDPNLGPVLERRCDHLHVRRRARCEKRDRRADGGSLCPEQRLVRLRLREGRALYRVRDAGRRGPQGEHLRRGRGRSCRTSRPSPSTGCGLRFATLSGQRLRLALAQIVFTAGDPGVGRVRVRTELGPLPGFDRPLTVGDFGRES